MKKYILIIILLISNIALIPFVSAEKEIVDNKYQISFTTLEQLKIVENIKETWNKDDLVKRRECLEIICYIMGGQLGDPLSTYPFGASGFKEKFTDIDYETEEYRIVISSIMYGILRGKRNDKNELIADLEGKLTIQETLTFINRMLMGNLEKETDYSHNEQWWYSYALNKNIINTGLYDSDIYIEYSQKDENIKMYDFLYLIYKAIHAPVNMNYTYGYGTIYFIDQIWNQLENES